MIAVNRMHSSDKEVGVGARTPQYKSWHRMKTRCRDKDDPIYGGRGISYDPSWEYYTNFLKDMGPRPPKHDIDRIDNDGNYCKENCRWVTRSTNLANKRRRSNSYGASINSNGRGFYSRIYIEGRIHYLGSFSKKIDAQIAYVQIFNEWYGKFPNGWEDYLNEV